ncbi:MAG TPA: FAD-binding oxidoreductase [Acidimicrobiales bacterium]|nr:FAD-binding oxidoreductase [Acidimicrobiales bacterium]
MIRPPLPAELGPDAAGSPTRFGGGVDLDAKFLDRLSGACAKVDDSASARVMAGRDWWPLSVQWAVEGINPALPAAVATPGDAAQVSAVLNLCNEARVPVVPFAGRSGVCGGSVPVFGGVSLDLTGLTGIADVDDASLLVDVRAGTFGDEFEETLRASHSMTGGHWPQSIALSTVGGWVACRGAGQYSTRYGKIEDMVSGLEVVLADGSIVHTGGKAPRAATGPDLTQIFVGSEGTLGVVTRVLLRVHPLPPAERRAAFGFSRFHQGLEACRLILRRGATPAVLRLYDPTESERNFEISDTAVLIAIDEGDRSLIDSVMKVVEEECVSAGADALDEALCAQWLEHRNNVPPLESLARGGIVADTVEIAARWSALPAIYHQSITRLGEIQGTLAASAHESHAYTDGACLYFTFAGRPDGEGLEPKERYYRAAFDAITSATEDNGGAISHHHGIGLNRAPYLEHHLGPAFDILAKLKAFLDPNGILNPGKLHLPSPFGERWPLEAAPKT